MHVFILFTLFDANEVVDLDLILSILMEQYPSTLKFKLWVELATINFTGFIYSLSNIFQTNGHFLTHCSMYISDPLMHCIAECSEQILRVLIPVWQHVHLSICQMTNWLYVYSLVKHNGFMTHSHTNIVKELIVCSTALIL